MSVVIFGEVVFQTILAYLALLLLTRILGKEQISQLTFYDYVSGITIGSMTAVLATDVDAGRTWVHLTALLLFGALVFASSFLSERSRVARKLLEGEPVVVIHNGKILESNMASMRYNLDNLTSQLRQKDVFNMGDVEFAVLEPNGELSVLIKADQKPVTPQDFNIPSNYEGIPTELIMDGQIIYPNLQQNKLNEKWLMDELRKQGVFSLGEVEFAALDSNGVLYVDKKQDILEYVTDISDRKPS